MTTLPDRLVPLAHGLMRIVVAFLWWTHGAQKLFGWFGGFGPGGGAAELMTRFGAAGTIEFVLGTLVMLGVFTRPAAFLASGEMAVTYFWMHAGSAGSIWPWANRGELPALYAFVFLFIAAAGPGALSLEGWWRGRREPSGGSAVGPAAGEG